MSLSDRLAARFASFAGRNGAAVTLRRRHTLKSQRAGKPTSALTVSGAALAGAAVITLAADLLTGVLLAGAHLTVAGDLSVYTTTADTEAAGGLLTAVPFSPPLAAPAADAAAVTVTVPYVDYPCVSLYDQRVVDTLDGGEQQERRVIHLAALGAGVTPAPTDHLVVDAVQRPIAAVEHVDTGTGPIRWAITLGAGA